jgi:hypothetical protein
MRRAALAMGLALATFTASGMAQRTSVGIAPAFDAGGDDFGPAVVEHLTLFTYQDLLPTKQFAPVLLNPGGVYTPLDTSWLTEYAQDRPDLDLLLVETLKPIVNGEKGAWTIVIQIDLLDAKTGDTKSTWTVSELEKSSNSWLTQGRSLISSAVNQTVSQKASQYGVDESTSANGFGMLTSADFDKQPLGKTTQHLADLIRDSLPAHLGGFVHTGAVKPDAYPAGPSVPCMMHTRITYAYKHVASHSYTMLANGLDETTTIQDGISSFSAPEGPMLLQFTIHDAPYRLSAEPVYQLSTNHSCKAGTLIIDLGQGGDAHDHWE